MNGAHSLNFVDNLFESTSNDNTSHLFDKKNCMGKLFYQYLAGEPISMQMTNLRMGQSINLILNGNKLSINFLSQMNS